MRTKLSNYGEGIERLFYGELTKQRKYVCSKPNKEGKISPRTLILLKNVCDKNQNFITDHLWIDVDLKTYKKLQKKKSLVKFHATVTPYIKGLAGKKGLKNSLFVDIGLSNLNSVCDACESEIKSYALNHPEFQMC